MELAVLEEAATMHGGQYSWICDGAGLGGGVVVAVRESRKADKFGGGAGVGAERSDQLT